MAEIHDELARQLAGSGVAQAFVVPSIHNLGVLTALDEHGVRCTATRTELGAAHMADGHARVSGCLTVLVTSTGPGAGNAIGACATAAKDGAGLVHVTTTNFPAAGRAHGLHTVLEQSSWFDAFGATVVDLNRKDGAETLAATLAGLGTRKGKAGATVLVPVAEDRRAVLPADTYGPQPDPRPVPSPETVRKALGLWLAGDRRLLWVGGGARALGRERLVGLAERTGAGVVTTVQGKDLFPADHPQFLGCTWNSPDVRAVAGEADACLALGSRFTELSTAAWSQPFPAVLIRVGGPARIGWPVEVDHHLDLDVAEALHVLDAIVVDHGAMGWGREAAAEVRARRERTPRTTAHALLAAIGGALSAGDVVVADMTKLSFWSVVGLELPAGARFLFPGLLNMGFGLPAALGASLAAPHAHVVALIGDGSLVSVLPELDIARTWPGRMTVVLLDDDGYGLLEHRLPEKLSASLCSFPGPRWEDIAAGFGVRLEQADGPDALAARLGTRPTAGLRIVRVDVTGLERDWRSA